jgi:hypothetical protein
MTDDTDEIDRNAPMNERRNHHPDEEDSDE